MKRQTLYSRLLVALFLFLIGAIYYRMLSLTPPMVDDYYYHFRILSDGEEGAKFSILPITSWEELAESIYNLGLIHNWRLANVIYIIVDYIGGLSLLNVLNSILLIAFLTGLAYLCLGRITLWSLGVSTSLGMIMLAEVETAFMWHVATLNYLWGGTLLIYLLISIRKSLYGEEIPSHRKIIIVCFLCFVCGWMHEGIGLPVLAGIILYLFAAHYKNIDLPYKVFVLYLAALTLGLTLGLLSPALWHRGDGINPISISFWKGIFNYFSLCLPASVIFLIVFPFHFRYIIQQPYFFILIPETVLGMAAAGSWGGACFYPSLFMLILVLLSIRKKLEQRKAYTALAAILTISLILLYQNHAVKSIYDDYTNILQLAKTNRIVSYSPSSGSFKLFEPALSLKLVGSVADPDEYHSLCRFVGKYHNQADFYVVFNTVPHNNNIYDIFHGDDRHQASWRKTQNQSLVRLPEGWIIKGKRNLQGFSRGHLFPIFVMKPNNRWGTLRSIFNFYTGKKEAFAHFTYDHGFHYIILSEESLLLDHLKLNIYNETTRKNKTIDLYCE